MEKDPADTARLVGGLGWAAIAAYVVAWDCRAEETLSAAFSRRQPYSGVALGVTAAHLMGWIPDRYDPFVRGLDLIKRGATSS